MRILPIVLTAFSFLPLAAHAQQNTCQYANDNECDEARYQGTGACADGTDAFDCGLVALGQGDNSCEWANDNECDEPRYMNSTNTCRDGTDTNDCSGAILQVDAAQALMDLVPANIRAQLGTDTCQYANDLECDDAAFGGTGACNAGTDATDCRPMAIGGDDSCEWANDTECDEPRYVNSTNACQDFTDTSDCAGAMLQTDATQALMDLVPDNIQQQLGTDSCRYANDLECDDAAFGGTGYCDLGTDATDCRALAIGGDDSCEWANDNECDEPGIGGNYCASGTDTTDCATVAFLRNRDDSCSTAFNSICDEPGTGTGLCASFSDTADCEGRGRPAEAGNHYFGRDDRILVDVTQMPWRAIGLLTLPGGTCTGTLVGPRLVLTAAHCLTEDGKTIALPLTFHAGLAQGHNAGKAMVVSASIAPDYTPETFAPGGGNGNDWGLVVLDRDLGLDVGTLEVHLLDATDLSDIGGSGMLVNQAGYSWDTGTNLSGHIGCRVTEAFEDDSFLHECDTTQGDSGSPIMVRRGNDWEIIGVDSQFFDPESKNSAFASGNLATDSRAFYQAVLRAQ